MLLLLAVLNSNVCVHVCVCGGGPGVNWGSICQLSISHIVGEEVQVGLWVPTPSADY